MSKRARGNGARAIERRLAEGRGQGRGRKYRPWFEIHDVPSQGLASRVRTPLNGRTCHLLSQLETDWFFAFHALPGLVDVREQYPLFDLDETLEIAAQLGIAHPTDPRSKEPCVATTDFLLTLSDGPRELEIAIAVKPSADLASQRTLEKLEIERVYWAARNINWRILTEKELPPSLVKNMKWLLPYIDLAESGEFTGEQILRIQSVIEPLVNEGRRSLVEIAIDCDDKMGLKAGSALCIARHLIATGAWTVDLTSEIDPRQPLHLVRNGGPHALTCAFAA